ncbi:uncharacterized protein EV422DRAFT_85975 [Fimicolochytrium jonesii]|uniref:uncharacterized protein n=1 Tax=Fimicolochytrium jonesii TaxID=1396493 RepID=UPI0022FDC876|nr:uncharacterized protein EV422DRAFT_85975 [Fimicolochytrium jonesii]KAI8820282.1 hypothetical protein EV422DRAFT_85975 [Fimicolochytrium jonesii]
MPGPTSIADAVGIHSVALPIVFLVVYVALFFVFLWKLRRNPVAVFIFMVAFCVFRVAAFAVRAAIAASDSLQNDLNWVLTANIIYTIGFFGLVYSAYSLLVRRAFVVRDLLRGPFGRLLPRVLIIVRVSLVAAITLGITGACLFALADPGSEKKTLGDTLRHVSLWIFLVLVALLLVNCLFVLRHDHSRSMLVLTAIAALLFARELYQILAWNKPEATDEIYFFTLSCLTELIAVILFLVPNVVPSKNEVEFSPHRNKDYV